MVVPEGESKDLQKVRSRCERCGLISDALIPSSTVEILGLDGSGPFESSESRMVLLMEMYAGTGGS